MRSFVFILFVCVFLAGNDAMEIEIEHKGGPTLTSFTVTCHPGSKANSSHAFIAIQISKNGGKPLVMLRRGGVSYDSSLRSSSKAEGQITDDNLDTKLTLSFPEVLPDDKGTYSCAGMYLDQSGHLLQSTASKTFMVQKPAANDAQIQELMEKMATMVTVLESQHQQLVKQGLELETLGETTAHSIKQVSSKVNGLEQMQRYQTHMIGGIAKRESFACAFRAGGDHKFPDPLDNESLVRVRNGETVVLPESLDVGGHFDEGSGVFTAPIDGLYAFHLYIRFKAVYYIDLLANDQIVGSRQGQAWGSDDSWVSWVSNGGPLSTVLKLQGGDTVRPVVRIVPSKNPAQEVPDHELLDGTGSLFSGYLVHTF